MIVLVREDRLSRREYLVDSTDKEATEMTKMTMMEWASLPRTKKSFVISGRLESFCLEQKK